MGFPHGREIFFLQCAEGQVPWTYSTTLGPQGRCDASVEVTQGPQLLLQGGG